MGIHSSPLTRPHQINVHCIGLKGVSAQSLNRENRAPEKCCRGTIPGYTQVIVGHDGNNPLLGERRGWVTHIARQSGMEVCEQFQEENVVVYVVGSEDRITDITLAICTLTTQGLEQPTYGLWQVISLRRPGRSEELYLPRLLIPLESKSRQRYQ